MEKEQKKLSNKLFTFDRQAEKWVDYELDSLNGQQSIEQNLSNSNLKTLTFNILFDKRISERNPTFIEKFHIKFSDERFRYSINKIATDLQPDVATFNEVTPRFGILLKNNTHIQQNYLISECKYNPLTQHDIEGNMIIVKKSLKPIKVDKIFLKSHNEPIPVVFFWWNKAVVAVAAVHLVAFQSNHQQRKAQLEELVTSMRSLQKSKEFDGRAMIGILQGDMNFHSEEENKMLEGLGLTDCWLRAQSVEQNDNQEKNGYTFDALENQMIQELYWGYQKRRMRLDRVFVLDPEGNTKHPKQPKGNFPVKDMRVVLNEPIYPKPIDQGRFLGWSNIALIGDIIGRNLIRNKQNYLYPSDHFGLLTQFQPSN